MKQTKIWLLQNPVYAITNLKEIKAAARKEGCLLIDAKLATEAEKSLVVSGKPKEVLKLSDSDLSAAKDAQAAKEAEAAAKEAAKAAEEAAALEAEAKAAELAAKKAALAEAAKAKNESAK